MGSCTIILECGEVCLQDDAQYTCTINGDLLTWTLPDASAIQIGSFDTNVSVIVDETLFTAVTNFSNNQLTSTLLFMTTIQFNNIEIMCTGISSTENCNVKISGIMEEPDCFNSNNIIYTITHVGKPSVPLNISVTTSGPNTVVVSWPPPLNSSQCIDHYVVNIVNAWKYNI